MQYPSITIDLDKIEHNARVVTGVCGAMGVAAVGVVKACLGDIDVAQAMIRGGVSMIADSRLANLKRLQAVGVPLMMLRQPMIREIPEVVSITDVCLVSEVETVKAISGAAHKIGSKYGIIVMVELGDLREGVMPGDLDKFIEKMMDLPGIGLVGIGANVACLQGVPPTSAMLDRLADMAAQLRARCGIELPVVSGGNSSAWKLLEAGTMPVGINQLRIGEAILLGQETVGFEPIAGAFQDAVLLKAEIIELKDKPTAFAQGGEVKSRALLAVGSQDICQGELRPLDCGVRILKRSSDHLVVEVGESSRGFKIGDCMRFIPSYEAMLAAMTSPFVEKIMLRKSGV